MFNALRKYSLKRLTIGSVFLLIFLRSSVNEKIEQKPDFNFYFWTFADSFDLKSGTYIRNCETKTDTACIEFSPAEVDRIFAILKDHSLFELEDHFVPPALSSVLPVTFITTSIRNGGKEKYTCVHPSCNAIYANTEVKKVRESVELVSRIIESKPEVKKMPPAFVVLE
ncbi:hypothetical protein [Siphonobacter aquaeclarae]|uniref:Uncharacterized protein n=1 Tax=Siphonobacter aquaeclarae TaxID=563176 RepID=A0A1G9HX58_9BACT|nr:hypothetical protein [Siphonobacter aquaeclarae]SDL17548.1 hypothetical protein SAMN04488090_0247 [Siphonobacter aquaeclarae]